MMSFLSRRKIENTIPIQSIDPDALTVLRRLHRAGFIAYLVGGGVRDLLLQRTPKDFDVATNASPNQIRRLFRNAFIIGRRFRLVLVVFGTKQIETATFRRSPTPEELEATEDPTVGALYQSADNAFGTPEEDALRRDFTVNGLFYDIESAKIIDYTGGLRDLAKRTLRSIGDPNIRFREDPVRMLRAVRLAARLDFTIHTESAKAISRHCGEIMQASKPRLFEEVTRLFTFCKGHDAFQMLWKSGLMAELMPAVATYVENSGGTQSPLWRYLAALDALGADLETTDRESPHYVYETALRLAVLLTPLFLERCHEAGSQEAPLNLEARTEELINEVLVSPFSTKGWRIPKLMCQDISTLLQSLSFYLNPSVKRTRYFRNPCFYSALIYWRISVLATQQKSAQPVVDSWARAYEEFVISHPKSPVAENAQAFNPAAHESESEQRESLFPPKKKKHRRKNHRHHRPHGPQEAHPSEDASSHSTQASEPSL